MLCLLKATKSPVSSLWAKRHLRRFAHCYDKVSVGLLEMCIAPKRCKLHLWCVYTEVKKESGARWLELSIGGTGLKINKNAHKP